MDELLDEYEKSFAKLEASMNGYEKEKEHIKDRWFWWLFRKNRDDVKIAEECYQDCVKQAQTLKLEYTQRTEALRK